MAANDVAQGGQQAHSGDGNIGQPPGGLIRYTVFSSVIVLVSFCSLLWALSGHGIAGEETLPGGGDVYSAGIHTLLMIATTFVSGALGGCLYSLRGLIKHSARNDFNVYYNYWYLLSPLSGGISGIVVFFLLLGGALTLNISTSSQGLRSIEGLALAPYIAFALLAGYASRTFMLKMKDVADSLFSLKNDD